MVLTVAVTSLCQWNFFSNSKWSKKKEENIGYYIGNTMFMCLLLLFCGGFLNKFYNSQINMAMSGLGYNVLV